MALCAFEKSHRIPISRKPTISRSSSRLRVFRSVRQICSKYQKKNKPRIRQSIPRLFLRWVMPWLIGPVPRTGSSSQLRIVFDPENGNRDDDIGASLHQPCQRFFEIGFRKDDQRHDRLTKDFDPPLESHEGNIGPGDGNETVEQKSDKPTVVPDNF